MIRALVRAAEVLKAFRQPGEVLRLRDVVNRTGLEKNTAFRLLYTLHKCSFLEKLGTNEYRCAIRLNERKYRIGYASGGDNSLFNLEVTKGLVQAAEKENVEVLVVDNRYSPKVALRVIEQLIKERVDLIIEYQSDYRVAPVIASKCAAQNIPLIAVEIPHPGAVYFGANNYEAGLVGGHYLAKWAKTHWQEPMDEIILLEQRRAGPVPQARLLGTLTGIREVLPNLRQCRTTYLDGDSDLGRSQAVVHNHLRFSTAKRILVGALDDICALGALRAFEEAGRLDSCVVMGQNAAPEARMEMRRPGTRLIGSVGYFPESYGDGLVRLALSMLGKKPVPPAVFVKHHLITPENVDRFYPNDALMGYPS
jgi:ribose transport system substrate-binding protein